MKPRIQKLTLAVQSVAACVVRAVVTKLLPFCTRTDGGSHLRPLSMAATAVRHWFWMQRNPTAYCNGVPLGRIHKEHSSSKPACAVNIDLQLLPVVRQVYSDFSVASVATLKEDNTVTQVPEWLINSAVR